MALKGSSALDDLEWIGFIDDASAVLPAVEPDSGSFESAQHKDTGDSLAEEFEDTGKPKLPGAPQVIAGTDDPKCLVSVRGMAAHTSSLGDYEFASVSFDVTAHYRIGPGETVPMQALARVSGMAEALVRWEALRAKGKSPDLNDLLGKISREGVTYFTIEAEYRLTLNIGNMNSVKVGVGMSVPAEPDGIVNVVLRLSEALEDRLTKRVERFKQKRGIK